jgi:hypothetical protein
MIFEVPALVKRNRLFFLLPSEAHGWLAGGRRDCSFRSQLALLCAGHSLPSTGGTVAPPGPAILAPSPGATDICQGAECSEISPTVTCAELQRPRISSHFATETSSALIA